MRLMDILEILYYKKGKEFGILEKKMKEIFNETGVSLEPVNSELIGRIFLKISVLEEGEEVRCVESSYACRDTAARGARAPTGLRASV